ncbi:MAG: hypothetical protein QM532_01885 [Cyanobium sp. MAG06]|nr:hypothetical protein [Cyanobium sp. MAG06]
MSPDELFDYMKNKGIISADSQKDMPLAPIGEDYSKEELDKLLKEADEIFQ